MNKLSRREFLRSITATTLVAVVGRSSVLQYFNSSRPFELLVVGDSLIWGQGLEEKDKFYSLVAEWLRREAFGKPCDVNMKVKAHSGATIFFDPKEAAKYRAAGRDENHFYKGEVNVSTPSISKQVETAAAEYSLQGRTRGADLVLLTAGVTDISVEGVLNPYEDPQKLKPLIEEVCGKRVGKLLEQTGQSNPDAQIGVIGYYPMLSKRSSRKAVFNAWLEVLDVPNWKQGFANNPIMRPILFGRLFNRAVERSRIWSAESDRQLKKSIAEHNSKVGREQAIFISSPLTEENTAEAPNTLLFRMRKNGTVEDPQYLARKSDCKEAFVDLERTTGIKYHLKRCTVAAVGHPNPAGARSYFEAIKTAIKPILTPPS
ncbi:MAG: hypothetical protein WBC19_01800 [Pyrinomonadaceae bacterium]